MSRKTVLITGANGQLGNSLVKVFNDSLFKVIKTSFSKNDFIDIQLDLISKDSISTVMKTANPDFIINCCACTNVDYCEINKKEAHDINVESVKNLLIKMPNNAKLIHISTDYIFDGLKPPYSENSIPNPINYYGKTKLEAENLIRSSQRNYTIIRVSNLFSEFIDFSTNKLNWILNSLKNEKKIFAATDIISKPTFTASLAHLIKKLIPYKNNLIINYAGQNSLSFFEFSILISKVFNLNKELIIPVSKSELNFQAPRPFDTSLNTDLANTLINDCNIYETEYSLKIIKDILK